MPTPDAGPASLVLCRLTVCEFLGTHFSHGLAFGLLGSGFQLIQGFDFNSSSVMFWISFCFGGHQSLHGWLWPSWPVGSLMKDISDE